MSHDPWDPHRDERIDACLRWSYAERLRWLDQAKCFAAAALGAAGRQPHPAPLDPPPDRVGGPTTS